MISLYAEFFKNKLVSLMASDNFKACQRMGAGGRERFVIAMKYGLVLNQENMQLATLECV